MQKKYYVIIFSSTLLVAIIFVLYLKFYDRFTEVEKHSHIEFLNISNCEADSVLSSLSLDDLLDKLIISNDFLHKNDSSSPLKLFNYKKYLSAINDSAIIMQLLYGVIDNSYKSYIFCLDENELNGGADSNYIAFLTHKYDFYRRVVNKKNVLCGCKIDTKHLHNMQNQIADTNYFSKYLYKKIINETDIVLIDSCNYIDNDFRVDGILISGLNDDFSDDNQLVKILNTNSNVFYTDSLYVNNVKSRVKKLIKEEKYPKSALQKKLRKLIKAEIWRQKTSFPSSDNDSTLISERLISQYFAEKSMCLLNNYDSILPLKNNVYDKRLLIIYFGKTINKNFQQNISHYINADYKGINTLLQAKSLKRYRRYNKILFVDTLLNDSVLQLLFQSVFKYGIKKNSIIVNIANIENLRQIPDSFACLQTQEKSDYDYRFAAQAIFGGINISGVLPHDVGTKYKFGSGFKTNKTRLKYTIPEDAGINAEKLMDIDNIANEGISMGAFPACQIFVARRGKVVYNKSFGYHSYSNKQKLEADDIFDLASVTKIAATTIATMKMNSDKELNLNDKLGVFFKDTHIDYTRIKPDTLIQIDTFNIKSISNLENLIKQNDTLNINDSIFITTDTLISKISPKLNIFKVPLEDLLLHKSGISPAVPVFRYMFYKTYFLKELKKKHYYKELLSRVYYKNFEISNAFPDNVNLPDSVKNVIKKGFKEQYDKYFTQEYIIDSSLIQLTDNQYFKQQYFDTVWRDIKQAPVFSGRPMQYSDLNMVLLQMAIDSLNNETLDDYLKRTIYHHLGLKTITYLPLQYCDNDNIVPTEIADNWRHGLLKGFVQDPSAALLGGIAGNAGLFSNAHDLGVLFQMLLNGGSYGGQQFINADVVKKFTTKHAETQRALGFDMPNRKAIVGSKASKRTFGHSGYTGTCVWVDPDNELVYVFLSNRNYPTCKNWKIVNHKIRERIHDAIYYAIVENSSSN